MIITSLASSPSAHHPNTYCCMTSSEWIVSGYSLRIGDRQKMSQTRNGSRYETSSADGSDSGAHYFGSHADVVSDILTHRRQRFHISIIHSISQPVSQSGKWAPDQKLGRILFHFAASHSSNVFDLISLFASDK
jgi:hypothetical protein